jgi:von Willebrand factor A domain-containing protein 5
VKRNAVNSRLFALGVGDSCSHHLVDGIAKAGGGTNAFVGRDENVQKATLSQLKNALQPSLTSTYLKWLRLKYYCFIVILTFNSI